jgi:recombination endonuclease VII
MIYSNSPSINREMREILYQIQKGRCAICGVAGSIDKFGYDPNRPAEVNAFCEVKKLVLDHNHDTGLVRGLICSSCNARVGVVEMGFLKDREYMRRLQAYLESPPASN